MTSCAAGPCNEERLEGEMFCAKHGPTKSYERKSYAPTPVNGDRQLVCPHCQTKGSVRTKQVKTKAGVSGGKATAAVLTAGISILGTGLSRKQKVTEAICGSCKMTWHVA